MRAAPANEIIHLRQLLAERFPHLRTSLEAAPKPRACWPTGLPQLDTLLHGGLPKSAITELVSEKTSGAGSALLLHAILRRAHENNQLLALIDGHDSFDATAFDQEILSRLLWVRCQNTDETLKATDILLRDRNLPLLVLDLKMNPATQLRKISGTIWYRLQRIVQQTTTAFFIITPFPMISSADARIVLQTQPFHLSALSQEESELLPQLKFELARGAFEQSTATPVAEAG